MNLESVRRQIIKNLVSQNVACSNIITICDEQIMFWLQQGQCVGQMAMLALTNHMESRMKNG
jgi:hypothetical protein